MALRIDFFSVEPGHDLEREDLTPLLGDAGHHPDAAVRWEGHVAASDTDEAALVDLVSHWAGHGVLDGIGVQGVSETARPVGSDAAAHLLEPADAAGTDGGLVREWSVVASHCVTVTVASGRHIGWWTRYDEGGSVDAGAEEWATGSSLRGTA